MRIPQLYRTSLARIRFVREAVLACAAMACAASSVRAELLFTETFQYTIGSNLAGRNGGTGFSGAWSGGKSTIVAGLASGSGNSVQIGTAPARQMATTSSTSGMTTYITHLMNPSSFTGGTHAGSSFFNDATEEMFMGIPWQTQKFGFDAHAGIAASPSSSEAAAVAIHVAPEPPTYAMALAGLACGAYSMRRRKRA